MKTFFAAIMVLGLVTSSCTRHGYVYNDRYDRGYNNTGYNNYTQGNFQLFYDNLSPYGQWVSDPEYGYVWIPDVRNNFFPYSSNGHWVMTEYGWTWLSDYSWGWAPFHYGRWDYDNGYGWFWVPGDQWGPAWVTWRRADGYYGWSPMRPGMDVNSSIMGGPRDVDRWVFVRDRDFGRADVQRRYVSRRDNENIFRSSSVINNTYIDNNRNTTYIAGPRPDEVQRTTGRRIERMPVTDSQRPGQRIANSQVQIYRPQIRESGENRSVPQRVTEAERIRSPRNRGVVDRNIDNRGMGRRVPDEVNRDNSGQMNRSMEKKEVQSQSQSQRRESRARQKEERRIQEQNRKLDLNNEKPAEEKNKELKENIPDNYSIVPERKRRSESIRNENETKEDK